MNVYDIWMDSNRKWARYVTIEGPVIPLIHEDVRTLFDRQPRIRIERDEKSTPCTSKAKPGDFSCLDHGPLPMFSERAKQVLEPYIGKSGQWLKLECDESPYWLFNVTNVIDALDESKSELLRFADGKVLRIARFAFHPERLRDQMIFGVSQRPLAHNLVTDEFVRLAEHHKLTGFEFKRVWSSEVAASTVKAA